MKQVLIWILIFAIGAGAFAALILAREWLDPVLIDAGLDPEGGIVLGIIKVVTAFFIGIPVVGLIYSLIALGSDAGKEDTHGYTLLRLKAGARYFLSAACVAFGVLFFFVAPEGHIAFQAAMMAIGVAAFFAAWWVFSARIRYDGSTLFITAYSGLTHRHEWADLVDIKSNKEAMEFHLFFRDGRKARVSFFYQGLDGLMALAWDRLDQNHA